MDPIEEFKALCIHDPYNNLEKFTGLRLTAKDLGNNENGQQIMSMLWAISSTEEMIRSARNDMVDLVQKIKTSIEAQPGERVMPFFPMGEVSGSKIGQLDVLLERWGQQTRSLDGFIQNILTTKEREALERASYANKSHEEQKEKQ